MTQIVLRPWFAANQLPARHGFQFPDKRLAARGTAITAMTPQIVYFGIGLHLIEVGLPIVDKRTHTSGSYQPVGSTMQVEVHAGPSPFVGLSTQPGANGVKFDITGCREQVILVHDKRVKSFLPKMSLPVVHSVNASRIAGMRSSQQRCERISGVRNQDHVHVIRHQAVGQDVCIGFGQLLCEQVDVRRIVVIIKECLLSSAAPLRHMMGIFGYD